jgi:hypothetical protein
VEVKNMKHECPNDCEAGRLMVIKGWPGNGPMNEPEPAICEACDTGRLLAENEHLKAWKTAHTTEALSETWERVAAPLRAENERLRDDLAGARRAWTRYREAGLIDPDVLRLLRLAEINMTAFIPKRDDELLAEIRADLAATKG